jgi:hypothetical protein
MWADTCHLLEQLRLRDAWVADEAYMHIASQLHSVGQYSTSSSSKQQ